MGADSVVVVPVVVPLAAIWIPEAAVYWVETSLDGDLRSRLPLPARRP